jgi:hypothetical protein
MDGSRFDAWSRALVTAHSRRGLIRLLSGLALGGSLALLGRVDTKAKHKKRKKKRNGVSGPPPSPPSPPGSTCGDTVHNCGGPNCPRCANGLPCHSAADCISARCFAGQCQACVPNGPAGQCGADVAGPCVCTSSGVCGSTFAPIREPSCDRCPFPVTGCPCFMGECACFPRCGASETCAGAGEDFCQGNTATCGQGGGCFLPLSGGRARCGVSAGPASCGCATDQECAPYGTDAFCVQITGSSCSCPGSFTTFCATPA